MTTRDKEHGYRRRYPSLAWPILLITAGVLFLLSNMGVLDVNFWELWRLWPLLLILGGLDIILGRRSFLGNIVVLLITIAVVAGVVIFLVAAPGALGPTPGIVERITEPLDGVERANLKVHFAAGQLDISQLIDSSSLVEGDLDLATRRKPTWTIDTGADRADMTLEYTRGGQPEDWNWRGGDEWDLRLSPQVRFSLDVDVGAGEATIDLTGLDIQDLKVTAGAGQTTVIFPQEGDFSATVSGGVGRLVIEIPADLAARIQVDRGLSALDISRRFEQDGDVYRTGDWEANENRVDLEIDVGVGLVTVREP